MVEKEIDSLVKYCVREEFKGYDPYDTLNSFINFGVFGKWGPPVAIQIQKRNPLNIRPLLGIKKGYNPKAIGLFLKAFCILYTKTKNPEFLEQATRCFNWLKNNYSSGFSGYAWGYNFDWASPGSFLKAYTPSVVVTSFVVDGIFAYYRITNSNKAAEIIRSSADYIKNDIPVSKFDKGIAFSYTHIIKDCCYNASLLAAEVLAKADFINGSSIYREQINKAIDFVLSKQRESGEWWYSMDLITLEERRQIDFHQGFVLVSLFNLNTIAKLNRLDVSVAIEKGLVYYKKYQFMENGRSLWRIPKEWPIEIHNQSQGIITFSMLRQFDSSYNDFATTIATWTIKNMQSKKGCFYYRINRFYKNKISYMRWSQAWMLLALSEILSEDEK